MDEQNKNILQRIASLRRLRGDLTREYNEIVLPWGLGHDMPENTSKKATEIMEHASKIQAQIEALEKEIGIESKTNIPEPNARPVSTVEFHWNYEAGFEDLVTAAACRMQWTYEQLSNYIENMGSEWIDQYAPQAAHLLTEQEFWLFISKRIRTVLAKLMGDVTEETTDSSFRRQVRQQIRFYLFSSETYRVFEYKFLSY
jgi:hypothetical protein